MLTKKSGKFKFMTYQKFTNQVYKLIAVAHFRVLLSNMILVNRSNVARMAKYER